MTRRNFITAGSFALIGLYTAKLFVTSKNMSEFIAPPKIISKTVEGIKIHCLTLGYVKVKRSHKNASLGMPQIMFDPFWTDWLPIHSWVLEHPEGVIVVDSGENVMAKQKQYYLADGTTGYVNRKILKFNIERSWEIDEQLKKINIQTEDVSKVVLTHLHLDHTDGLKYFPKSEIIVSKEEWNQPFGSMPNTFPSWLKPNKINVKNKHAYFPGVENITKDGRLICFNTAGHSNGHLSVGLDLGNLIYFFAGDTSFTQHQLLKNHVSGICNRKKQAKSTLNNILKYAKERNLIYLPSHDPESSFRFKNETFVF